MRVSVARSARNGRPVAGHSVQIPIQTGYSHCPIHRQPRTALSLSSVSVSFLTGSGYPRRLLSTRSHSSRPATTQGAAADRCFHPPHCVVFVFASAFCLHGSLRLIIPVKTPAPSSCGTPDIAGGDDDDKKAQCLGWDGEGR